MRLATAEGGIELDHGVAGAFIGQALHHSDQLTAQATRDIGQIKEYISIFIFILCISFPKRNFTQMDGEYT